MRVCSDRTVPVPARWIVEIAKVHDRFLLALTSCWPIEKCKAFRILQRWDVELIEATSAVLGLWTIVWLKEERSSWPPFPDSSIKLHESAAILLVFTPFPFYETLTASLFETRGDPAFGISPLRWSRPNGFLSPATSQLSPCKQLQLSFLLAHLDKRPSSF
jgi:hypothetical protein